MSEELYECRVTVAEGCAPPPQPRVPSTPIAAPWILTHSITPHSLWALPPALLPWLKPVTVHPLLLANHPCSWTWLSGPGVWLLLFSSLCPPATQSFWLSPIWSVFFAWEPYSSFLLCLLCFFSLVSVHLCVFPINNTKCENFLIFLVYVRFPVFILKKKVCCSSSHLSENISQREELLKFIGFPSKRHSVLSLSFVLFQECFMHL